jgi:hypothetical protein
MNPAYNPYLIERRYPGACSWVLHSTLLLADSSWPLAVSRSPLAGRHEPGMRITYVTGSPNDAAHKGYRIWYSVIAPGEMLPANPGDLHKSFYIKLLCYPQMR